MTVAMTDTTTIDQDTDVSFLWLEITGKCQLACEHCYVDSGPTGSLTSVDMTVRLASPRIVTQGYS